MRTPGTFESRVFDAGSAYDWTNLIANTTLPAETSAVFETRTGTTPTYGGATWSVWEAVNGGTIASPNARYAQYRVTLTTADPSVTPVVERVELTAVSLPPDAGTPVVTVPADMTVEATGPTGAVVTYSASALDDVDGAITPTCAPLSGSTFGLGATPVTCTATDKAGHEGSASFTVTVVDTTAPVIAVSADVTAPAESGAGAHVSYTAPAATDAVDPSVAVTCSPASGSLFPLGPTTVTCSATDAAGNQATPVTFAVRVADAGTPVVTVPADMTVEATGPTGAVVTYSASALDDVDGAITPTCAPLSGSTFGLGATPVTCTATDKAGHEGSASFTVTVVDTTAPVIAVSADVTAPAESGAGAHVSYTAPAATDAVDPSVAVTCSPASGSLFPLGPTTVTCSATDAAGNQATPVTFAVRVADAGTPVVTVPADMTVEATGPTGAVVTYSASALDDVDGAITPTCAPLSGSTFGLGATPVTCTATDKAGHEGSASFTVTVVDTTAPVIAVSADVTAPAESGAGAHVSYTAPAATDAVDPSVAVTCSPASGSLFPLGPTTVTCSATDAAGNQATPVTFAVRVADAGTPVVTVPADMTVEATGPTGAVVTYSASALDDVDGAITPTCAPLSGSTFGLGATPVTCTATDKAGHEGSASFTVTVVDTTAPVIAVSADVTAPAESGAGAHVSYTAPAATDAVDPSVAVTCSPASGSLFPLGPTTVTCSATDAAGNQATPVTFAVRVADAGTPVVTVPADMTVEATGPTGAVVTYSASALDDVDGAITPTCAPLSGSTFGLGATPVTCTATDKAGHEGSASFTVTVVDTTAPVIAVSADVTAPAESGAGAHVSYTAPTATDAVDPSVAVTCAPASGSLFPAGATTTVLCTATDSHANTASKSFTVTVGAYVDQNHPPTITNPGAQTSAEGASVNLQVQATDPDNDPLIYSATGLPGGLSIGAASGLITGTVAYDAAGSHSVTVTVDDGRGGTAPTTFTWTVSNTNRAPTITNPGHQATTVGDAVNFQVEATDPDGDTLTYGATGLPATLTISSTTGLITGTLTIAGDFSVTVTVTDDGEGLLNDSATFTWSVSMVPDEPPSTPTGLAARVNTISIVLDWENNSEPDLAGYFVYRSTTSGGPWTKVTATPISASAYTDTSAPVGPQVSYQVTAVDLAGHEFGAGRSPCHSHDRAPLVVVRPERRQLFESRDQPARRRAGRRHPGGRRHRSRVGDDQPAVRMDADPDRPKRHHAQTGHVLPEGRGLRVALHVHPLGEGPGVRSDRRLPGRRHRRPRNPDRRAGRPSNERPDDLDRRSVDHHDRPRRSAHRRVRERQQPSVLPAGRHGRAGRDRLQLRQGQGGDRGRRRDPRRRRADGEADRRDRQAGRGHWPAHRPAPGRHGARRRRDPADFHRAGRHHRRGDRSRGSAGHVQRLRHRQPRPGPDGRLRPGVGLPVPPGADGRHLHGHGQGRQHGLRELHGHRPRHHAADGHCSRSQQGDGHRPGGCRGHVRRERVRSGRRPAHAGLRPGLRFDVPAGTDHRYLHGHRRGRQHRQRHLHRHRR